MRSRRKRRARPSAAASADVRLALDALRWIVQALRTEGRPAGPRLSSAQLFALQQIADHPHASINDVAALTFTHQSSVSVAIQRLVGRRLVAKTTASDDRRRLSLVVTTEGRRVLRRAPPAAQERLIAAIAALPADVRRALSKSLAVIAGTMTPAGGMPHPPMFFEDSAQDQKKHGGA